MTNTDETASKIGRRAFFGILATFSTALISWLIARKDSIGRAAPFVKPKEKWTASHLVDFLVSLPSSSMLELKKSIGLLEMDATELALKGKKEDAKEILKHALWLSSNVFAYPFLDESKLSYHDLVKWIGNEVGLPDNLTSGLSTFFLERELQKLLFAQMWEKLDLAQREAILKKVDPIGTIKDKAAIAALGGAGAIAALSATVAFTGFAFYSTMSVAIASVASSVGLTLPFATYAGASTLVGVLSGPIGWAVMGISALGGLALAGRANIQKTTALIGLLHALKIEALIASGIAEKEIFGE